MSGESKRRRPLGPLDDYCDELEEEIEELTAERERVKEAGMADYCAICGCDSFECGGGVTGVCIRADGGPYARVTADGSACGEPAATCAQLRAGLATERAARERAELQLTEDEQDWFLRNGYGMRAGPAQLRHLIDQLKLIAPLLSRAGLSIVPATDVPTPEERAVLEAVAAIPDSELRSRGNWYGYAKKVEAVDTTARIHTIQSVGPEIAEALNAYRATAPKLRTRAEVDAEIALLTRTCVANECSSAALQTWEAVTRLCREETAPEEPNRVTDHDADTRELQDPEPCGCQLAERAAREKAEKESAQHKLEAVSLFDALNDATTSNEVGLKQLQQAERERDAALARVKELERAQISPDAYMPREEVARLGIAQKALADWENGLSEPWRTYVMSLETNANPSGNIRDAFCQRQNAEALAARVKELEIGIQALRKQLQRIRSLSINYPCNGETGALVAIRHCIDFGEP